MAPASARGEIRTEHDISATWLREVLARHDPLEAWPPTGTHVSDHTGEAAVAVAGMQRVLGLGHILTVIADAIDQAHPGFYRAARERDGEVHRPLALAARETWDFRGSVLPRPRPPLPPAVGPAPVPPLQQALAEDEGALTQWLRETELRLEADGDIADREMRTAGPALRSVFPALTIAYLEATDGQRSMMRLAVSRFHLVRYQLSTFAALQLPAIEGQHDRTALRHALLAESLLDRGLDWRDELLLLRDLRRIAEAAELPFADLLAEAAACASPEGAEFLLGVARE